PYFFKIITDTVVSAGSAVSVQMLFTPFIVLVILLLFHEFSFRAGHILETYITTASFRHITTSLYKGLIRRPIAYFEDKFSGDLGRRIEQVGTSTLFFIETFPWQMGW